MVKTTEEQPANLKEALSNTQSRSSTGSARKQTTATKWYMVSLFFSLGALIIAFYTFFINQKVTVTLIQNEQTILEKIYAIQQKQNNMTTPLLGKIKTLQENITLLQIQQNISTKKIESTLKQTAYQSNDWLILTAQHYLELAQINTHWSNNPKTALELLQQADKLLAKIQDQRIYSIRQAIANEAARVRAIPTLDIAGLLSQLDAAINMVAQIKIKQPTSSPVLASTLNKQPTSFWQEKLALGINLFKKMVIITRHDQEIQPLFLPSQETLLRENIRLNLQEIQWAILQNNNVVFRLLLTQAINNIHRSFDTKATDTQALIKQLENLQSLKLTEKILIDEQSLSLINQYIDANAVPKNNPPPPTADGASAS